MKISEYQRQAKKTDQFSSEPEKVMHHLLNLTESVGVLNRLIEQTFRGKELSDEYSRRRLNRKLGDILWYVANIAERYGLKLEQIAEQNLALTRERWQQISRMRGRPLDGPYPKFEQLPRELDVVLFDPSPEDDLRRILLCVPMGKNDWIQVGDRVDDNAIAEDGYRFHDVFHLANMAFLGWSPVIRGLLKRKRKSHESTDRVEDGARASHIEEAVTAFVFSYAKEVDLFADRSSVDFNILKTVVRVTHGFEVANRPYQDWEDAILYGYKIFRAIKAAGEGMVSVRMLDNNKDKRITISPIPAEIRASLVSNGNKG